MKFVSLHFILFEALILSAKELVSYWLVGVVFLVFSLAIALIMFCYIKKIKIMQLGYEIYTVYVDSYGKITKASSNFSSRFTVYEVFDKLLYKNFSIDGKIRTSLPLTIVLKDNDKKEAILMFSVRRSSGGYKLIGEEIMRGTKTMFMPSRRVTKINGIKNSACLYREFDSIRWKVDEEGGLFVVIEFENLFFYKSQISNEAFAKLQRNVDAKVRRTLSNGHLYKLSDDTYAYVIADGKKLNDFLKNCETIANSIKGTYLVEGTNISLNVCAGMVNLSGPAKKWTLYQIKDCAYSALIQAKDDRKKCCQYICPCEISSKRSLKKAVNEILENKSVDVFFQPQLSLETGKITGFETLCRITSAASKTIKVQEFIEHCENTGQIIGLGEYVFDRAFSFAKKVEDYDVSISLNVSPVQILQDSFEVNFLDKYSSYNLRRHSICVEITETFLVQSFDKVIAKLNKLYARGIDIHLDDFGIGYSSMLYLKKLPIDTIKIDREFVADIVNNRYSRVICSKIIDIANDLSLDIIAEGVETEEQMQLLNSMYCKNIQGFLISRAVPEAEAEQLLLKYNKT